MSKYPKNILNISRNLLNILKYLEISRILNILGHNFPQRELKSMSEIVYTSIMDPK